MISKLRLIQDRILKSFSIQYKRYIFEDIDFNDKMIAIFGARGVGKTTLLLQYLIELKQTDKNALYISLDYPFLSGVDLLELVEKFIDEGGEYLLLDEVHRYHDFSSYLKTIYDIYDINVIYTSSSATSLLNAKSDLSRRVSLYKLNGFSFREFLELNYDTTLQSLTLEKLIDTHIQQAQDISKDIDILSDFKEYLKTGYYPFYFDKRSSYFQNLANTINLTIDIDLPSLGLIEQKYTYKLKKLLEVICESKPFEVNYTKIAQMSEISRVKLYDYITYLSDGELLLLIDSYQKGLKKINKPTKIYLNNPNLIEAYCQESQIGTIRETFFANQISLKYKINISDKGDFLVDKKYIFEIGGKNKSFSQIKDIKNSFVIADDIEVGFKDKIPLWLFGFLY
jgi:predicted AAA+ superfamily ATPase